VTAAGQNGGQAGIYVTTMCGPYAPFDDTTGAIAGCDAALAALARGDICDPDGGSESPAQPEGGESGASGDDTTDDNSSPSQGESGDDAPSE
jgi:hypothetical protein